MAGYRAKAAQERLAEIAKYNDMTARLRKLTDAESNKQKAAVILQAASRRFLSRAALPSIKYYRKLCNIWSWKALFDLYCEVAPSVPAQSLEIVSLSSKTDPLESVAPLDSPLSTHLRMIGRALDEVAIVFKSKETAADPGTPTYQSVSITGMHFGAFMLLARDMFWFENDSGYYHKLLSIFIDACNAQDAVSSHVTLTGVAVWVRKLELPGFLEAVRLLWEQHGCAARGVTQATWAMDRRIWWLAGRRKFQKQLLYGGATPDSPVSRATPSRSAPRTPATPKPHVPKFFSDGSGRLFLQHMDSFGRASYRLLGQTSESQAAQADVAAVSTPVTDPDELLPPALSPVQRILIAYEPDLMASLGDSRVSTILARYEPTFDAIFAQFASTFHPQSTEREFCMISRRPTKNSQRMSYSEFLKAIVDCEMLSPDCASQTASYVKLLGIFLAVSSLPVPMIDEPLSKSATPPAMTPKIKADMLGAMEQYGPSILLRKLNIAFGSCGYTCSEAEIAFVVAQLAPGKEAITSVHQLCHILLGIQVVRQAVQKRTIGAWQFCHCVAMCAKYQLVDADKELQRKRWRARMNATQKAVLSMMKATNPFAMGRVIHHADTTVAYWDQLLQLLCADMYVKYAMLANPDTARRDGHDMDFPCFTAAVKTARLFTRVPLREMQDIFDQATAHFQFRAGAVEVHNIMMKVMEAEYERCGGRSGTFQSASIRAHPSLQPPLPLPAPLVRYLESRVPSARSDSGPVTEPAPGAGMAPYGCCVRKAVFQLWCTLVVYQPARLERLEDSVDRVFPKREITAAPTRPTTTVALPNGRRRQIIASPVRPQTAEPEASMTWYQPKPPPTSPTKARPATMQSRPSARETFITEPPVVADPVPKPTSNVQPVPLPTPKPNVPQLSLDTSRASIGAPASFPLSPQPVRPTTVAEIVVPESSWAWGVDKLPVTPAIIESNAPITAANRFPVLSAPKVESLVGTQPLSTTRYAKDAERYYRDVLARMPDNSLLQASYQQYVKDRKRNMRWQYGANVDSKSRLPAPPNTVR